MFNIYNKRQIINNSRKLIVDYDVIKKKGIRKPLEFFFIDMKNEFDYKIKDDGYIAKLLNIDRKEYRKILKKFKGFIFKSNADYLKYGAGLVNKINEMVFNTKQDAEDAKLFLEQNYNLILTQEEIDKHNEYEQEIYDINKNLFNLFK